jgi:DNA-binding transcriptional ArsR family regulator/uncharacterized protein YndB with AHSA1/START domain
MTSLSFTAEEYSGEGAPQACDAAQTKAKKRLAARFPLLFIGWYTFIERRATRDCMPGCDLPRRATLPPGVRIRAGRSSVGTVVPERWYLDDWTGDQMVTYGYRMADTFKALADPSRRQLLDRLFEADGQTLSALQRRLPMTRFGVMKHLKLLEEAGLVVTRRQGREKLHFLNAVPIRLMHDRWVNKFTAPWVAALSDLKHRLEDTTMKKIFEIYIKTTPVRLWQAITDTEMRRKYTFGAIVTSDWTPSSRYQALGGGNLIFEGENLEVDPPRRLVQSFRALWGEDVKSEGTSRVTWEIEPVGDSCLLKVTHDQLREDVNTQLYGGWPMILSGLKTLLETGEMLTTPGSRRWMPGAEMPAH